MNESERLPPEEQPAVICCCDICAERNEPEEPANTTAAIVRAES